MADGGEPGVDSRDEGKHTGRNNLARYMLSSCVRPSVCLSVCPFVRQTVVVSKRLDKSSWFLARRLPSAIPTLRYKEIGVSPKIKVLPSGTLVPNSGRRKFRHGKSIALSTKLVVDGRAC